MLLFRALNEFDILTNPMENGLMSKKLIYDLTYSYLSINEKEFFDKVGVKE